MADEVKIEKDAFNSRLSHLISTWKNDKRQSNDALFGGVGSIVVLMGKNEENPAFHKNNAMHVRISIGILADQELIGAHVVLASWVRVSRYPHGLHPRSSLHCYDCKERYESFGSYSRLVLITFINGSETSRAAEGGQSPS